MSDGSWAFRVYRVPSVKENTVLRLNDTLESETSSGTRYCQALSAVLRKAGMLYLYHEVLGLRGEGNKEIDKIT